MTVGIKLMRKGVTKKGAKRCRWLAKVLLTMIEDEITFCLWMIGLLETVNCDEKND